ncbi:hypothetical protein ABH963_000226 [Bacillus sp. RC55]|uniref:Uncharacterized protein n=1 Tax=Bacillus cereus BAG5X1-1 TaxID=1053189 RepID=J8ANQ0_BACCE|nr:hypothetical protein IEE_02907 [Bacillus cereus BAG5X1-1]
MIGPIGHGVILKNKKRMIFKSEDEEKIECVGIGS